MKFSAIAINDILKSLNALDHENGATNFRNGTFKSGVFCKYLIIQDKSAVKNGLTEYNFSSKEFGWFRLDFWGSQACNNWKTRDGQ